MFRMVYIYTFVTLWVVKNLCAFENIMNCVFSHQFSHSFSNILIFS